MHMIALVITTAAAAVAFSATMAASRVRAQLVPVRIKRRAR